MNHAASSRRTSPTGIIPSHDELSFMPLPELGIIGARGADAERFLQAQFTCDVAETSMTTVLPAAWCTAKGRVIATLELIRDDNGFLLVLPRSLCDIVLRRLSTYVLRAKVELATMDGGLDVTGIVGPLPDTFRPPEGVQLSSLRGPGFARTLALVPRQSGDVFGAALGAVGAVSRAASAWTSLSVLAGEAVIELPCSEQFLPQMLNLDLVGAVSFSKGCYPGQEIVARTHYLGRVKRRMYVGRTASAPPLPMMPVTREDGQVVGDTVSAGPDGSGGSLVSAVVSIEAVDSCLRVGNSPLSLSPPPYGLMPA